MVKSAPPNCNNYEYAIIIILLFVVINDGVSKIGLITVQYKRGDGIYKKGERSGGVLRGVLEL